MFVGSWAGHVEDGGRERCGDNGSDSQERGEADGSQADSAAGHATTGLFLGDESGSFWRRWVSSLQELQCNS